jgi:Ca2+-binding RTX toxin-like protein
MAPGPRRTQTAGMNSSIAHFTGAAASLPSRLAPALLIAVAALAAAAGPAAAAGCDATYVAATHVLTIDSCSHDPDAPTIAEISRTPAGSILLDDQAIAGGPTVTNTDTIVYVGDDSETDEITLDMSNGRFTPGYSPEPGGVPEIELTIDGGTGAPNFLGILGHATEGDAILLLAAGIDFGADGDIDLTRTNIGGVLAVDGQGGRDYLRGAGFQGQAPNTGPLRLRGGADNDVLGGGIGADQLIGGDGRDAVIENGAGFVLTDASLIGNGSDALASIEYATLSGSNAPDVIDASAFSGGVGLTGSGGDDTLLGGAGDDNLRGQLGDDVIDGGPGTDAVGESVLEDAVLTDVSMTGSGTDSLTSIEQGSIYGSALDQTLDASGFSGPTTIVAGPGADVLIGGSATDQLDGREGPDELRGGEGADAYLAGAGDDRVLSGDEVLEQVDCGDGADIAVADQLDGLLGCEQIDRGGAPLEPDEPDEPDEPAQPSQPSQPSTPSAPATPAADAIAPVLSQLALARRRFRAAGAGTALRFTLSEPATVALRIERVAPGRRAGGRCRAPSARNRARPRCKRFLRLRGVLTHSAAEGANRVLLRGRLGRRALRPGRYRLVATATDAAGNRSIPRRATFRIVAR